MYLVNFAERISKWNVITALCVAVVALAVMLCVRAVVERRFPDRTEKERETVILRVKVVCAAVMVAACILSVAF